MIASMLVQFGKSITVQRPTKTVGGYTGDTTVWNTHLTEIAVVRPMNGNDIITLQKIGLEADYKLYMEYNDIKESDRILLNGKYYLITWIQEPMTAGEFLQVYIKGSDNIGNTYSE